MSRCYPVRPKRGAVVPSEGKARISIYLDDIVIARFKHSLRKREGGIKLC
jgi:hypothetical protein